MYEDSHHAIAEQIIMDLAKPKFPRASKYKKALRDGSIYPNNSSNKQDNIDLKTKPKKRFSLSV
jgi:hypothetical protein